MADERTAPVDPASPGAAAMVIVIMGVSGSGKSTIGSLLAGRLGCGFLEGDAFHSRENVEKMRRGIPLDDADRLPWLGALATAAGRDARRDHLSVVACSALKHAYRDQIRTLAGCRVVFVLLQASKDELQYRLSSRPGHFMPATLLDSQLNTLEPPTDDEDAKAFDQARDAAALADHIWTWVHDRLERREPS